MLVLQEEIVELSEAVKLFLETYHDKWRTLSEWKIELLTEQLHLYRHSSAWSRLFALSMQRTPLERLLDIYSKPMYELVKKEALARSASMLEEVKKAEELEAQLTSALSSEVKAEVLHLAAQKEHIISAIEGSSLQTKASGTLGLLLSFLLSLSILEEAPEGSHLAVKRNAAGKETLYIYLDLHAPFSNADLRFLGKVDGIAVMQAGKPGDTVSMREESVKRIFGCIALWKRAREGKSEK